jgi:hypothetical protein
MSVLDGGQQRGPEAARAIFLGHGPDVASAAFILPVGELPPLIESAYDH